MQSVIVEQNLRPGWVVIALLFLLPNAAKAAVTLPLDGYCKPGRFFPIAVDGPDAMHRNVFSAEGCMPMEVEPQGSGVVPMLVTGSPGILRWNQQSLPLRVPGDNERLVGIIAGRIPETDSIFAHDRLLPIRLNPSDPLPGSPAAWEALDAIVLDKAVYDHISDSQRSVLLASGVILVAIGQDAPDTRWPWRNRGSMWILRHAVAGPSDEVVNAAVYAATFGWTPGWSSAVRMQVVGVAVLVMLAILGLLIRQTKWTLLAVISLCFLSAGGVVMWRRSLGNIDRAGGDVIVLGNDLMQRDRWVFERAKASGSASVPWAGWTHPLFASATGLDQSKMTLTISSAGQTAFVYQSQAGHTMAFIRREVGPTRKPIVDRSMGHSPMMDIMEAYLEPGEKTIGQEPTTNERWPGVVLDRK